MLEGSFESISNKGFPLVTLIQVEDQLVVSCSCVNELGKLCPHGAQVLNAVIRRDEFAVFFNSKLRHEKLKAAALNYGLENERDLDLYFQIEYSNAKLLIQSRLPGLLPVTKSSLDHLQKEVLVDNNNTIANASAKDLPLCVVFKRHKYYKYLVVELYSAQTTKEGRIKNPMSLINPMDLVWNSEDAEQIKFFSAIARFQDHAMDKRSASDLNALKAILKNPGSCNFYFHDENVSENLNASSLVSVDVRVLTQDIVLSVEHQLPFYKVSGSLNLYGIFYSLKEQQLRFSYFLLIDQVLYLVDSLEVLAVIDLFNKSKEDLLIHASKYEVFKAQVLKGLEDKITLDYKYIEPATPLQMETQGFDKEPERILYLADFGDYVTLTPVMKYGDVEIPVRSKRLIYATDPNGKEFKVERNEEEEINFVTLISRQHIEFGEQINDDMLYFCLHKKNFLDEEWFLNVFDEWYKQGIAVLGFNKIEELKLAPHKVKINIKVISGINWFNAIVDVRFGKKKASMKMIQKAIRKKSKYVQLDDGSLGILPQQWIERFTDYFNAAEIIDEDTLQIAKTNFSSIEDLYEENMLDMEVKKEIGLYRNKLSDFTTIAEVPVPEELNATLRPYQRQGLNWLNFLDDFNFGGCLADDMGLGKSIQVIAFILSQRKKQAHNTNLLVVPTTLIFNWQAEIKKFAPSLKVLTLYGAERDKNIRDFSSYEVVLTSYNTLLTDISFLKDYTFNYIFLDESQNIKNPETQRYKSVCTLKSRNKITITGTPIENNTFDLYGQFSFACPGMLGSKRYFREVYSMPIDKFKDSKRARELQNKIRPFLLRRTKDQVAEELPEKQETILYCEMKEAQQKIYLAYEKEFREYISAATQEDLRKSPMNVLKGLTRLRQICDSPALMADGELTMNEPSSKIEMLIEQIESKAPHHKILVFSQFVGMLDLIKKELEERKIRFSYLTGKTRNRQTEVDEFQNNKEVKVFLISLKAGGTGLNLTEADCVYLVDPWWNPAVENQAIDRSHRIGQNKKVLAVRLICPGTVEEKILLLQEAKKELADDLVKADPGFISSLSKEDLLGLFS